MRAPLLAIALFAASPASPKAASPERAEAARVLVHDVLGPAFFRSFWPEFRRAFLANFRRPAGMDEAEAARALDEEVLPMFLERQGLLQDALIAAYADAFTAEELNGLAAFFAAPLGQRFLALSPQVDNRIAAAALAWAQAIVRDRLPDIREAMGRRGMQL